MSLSTPRFLSLLEQLSRAGLQSELAPHSLIARGFADIGAEEYALLPGGKLVSLASGAVTQLPEEHKQFFFDVRSIDDLIEVLLQRQGSVDSISFPDGREWIVKFRAGPADSDRVIETKSAVLEEAIAEAVLHIFKCNR